MTPPLNLRRLPRFIKDYNFHSHTEFCDGRATMEEMAAAAFKAGLSHLGFSPHSPVPIESSCNMDAARVNEYLEEVMRLRRHYAYFGMNIYAGMEIDYLGPKWGPANEYFRSLPLDFRIGSVHFVPTPDGSAEIDVDGRPASFIRKMAEHFDNDIRYVVDTFYARSLEMIEAGGFDIIGHFDKIGFNASVFRPGIEEEPFYQRHISDMIEALRESDIVVEVNTKAWEAPEGTPPEEAAALYPRLFPSESVIRRLVKAGIPLVVNSDAHYPSRILTGRAPALAIIRQAEEDTHSPNATTIAAMKEAESGAALNVPSLDLSSIEAMEKSMGF